MCFSQNVKLFRVLVFIVIVIIFYYFIFGLFWKINETCVTIKCVEIGPYRNVWEREKVLVKVIPNNETKTFTKKRHLGKTNQKDTREEIELLLTSPQITIWAYELAFGLSEGFSVTSIIGIYL